MKITTKSANWTARDNFKVVNATALNSLKDAKIKVVDAAIGFDESNEHPGESVPTAYLKTDAGEIYTAISKTIRQQVEQLLEINEFPYDVRVYSRTAQRSGREFFVMDFC